MENTRETERELSFCGVCLENVDIFETASFNCNHIFCGDCVIKTLEHSNNKNQLKCYVCREKVKIINVYDDKNIYNGLKERVFL